ncbi:hypothetical protein LXL04_015003 [Taraxacum kok-saghyz]
MGSEIVALGGFGHGLYVEQWAPFVKILLNEVAPRPHNSGHHTIESCYTSQYEQHLRVVVGLPLGDPSMKTPTSIMYNILGEDELSDFTSATRLHFSYQRSSLSLHFSALVHLSSLNHLSTFKNNWKDNTPFSSKQLEERVNSWVNSFGPKYLRQLINL